MIADRLFDLIKEGRKGKNQGISMGLPKYESIVDGNTKQTYTLVISNSGAGKSSYVLYAYCYKPIMNTLDNENFKCLYCSLEMNAEMIMAKLLSTYIWETYNIEISIKELLSRKKDYILNDELFNIVCECKPWLDKVEKKLIIYDKSLNAETLYSILMKELEKLGSFQESDHRKIFIPNNSDLIFNVVIDHIGLLRPSKGRTLKEEIDLTSSYLVTLRNICGISPVIIQQTNRNQSSMERRKQNMTDFNISDAKDSGNCVQDCEVMVSIYNPNRDRLATYDKYNISVLTDKFRSITILKSRWGESDYKIAMNFFGSSNVWRELPKADEIYDYERYTSLTQKKTEEKSKCNINFNL